MSKQEPEQPLLPQEDSLKRELESVFERIKDDLATPAVNKKLGNRFREKLLVMHLPTLKRSSFLPDSPPTKTESFFTTLGRRIIFSKVPEINYLYQKTSGKKFVPDNPDDFFSVAKKAPTPIKNQLGISIVEIELLQHLIAQQGEDSSIQFSPFWFGVQLFNVLDIATDRKLVKHKQENYDPMLGQALFATATMYFHPRTIDSIADLAEKGNQQFSMKKFINTLANKNPQ